MSVRKTLPNTQPLKVKGDLAAEMGAGINRFLTRETEQACHNRTVSPNKKDPTEQQKQLAHILGVVDARETPGMQVVAPVQGSAEVAAGANYKVFDVR